MKTIKVLNLYAGIGGNRKLWENVKVTAVENNKEIAKIYQSFFPNDKVVVADAHKYLLEHYKEFDFIWSSPPCPTHSRFNHLFKEQECKKPRYPDMRLYQEIIFLKYWFKGKWVVENVMSYYQPLIKPFESGNHYFWSNFIINNTSKQERGIRTQNIETQQKTRGVSLDSFNIPKTFKKTILNNMVFSKLGLFVFNSAFKEQQKVLNLEIEGK